jgi:hypothetical protein
LDGRIERADLATLHFTKEAIRLKTAFDVDLTLNSWDDLTGRGFFQDVYLQKPNMADLSMDLVSFNSDVRSGGKRHYSLNSPYVSVEVNGDFVPSRMQNELLQLWDEYQLYFQKNEQERNLYYASKTHDTESRYGADFTIVCHDAAPLLSRFSLPWVWHITLFSPGISPKDVVFR